jgi:hypothetical protein
MATICGIAAFWHSVGVALGHLSSSSIRFPADCLFDLPRNRYSISAAIVIRFGPQYSPRIRTRRPSNYLSSQQVFEPSINLVVVALTDQADGKSSLVKAINNTKFPYVGAAVVVETFELLAIGRCWIVKQAQNFAHNLLELLGLEFVYCGNNGLTERQLPHD